MDVGGVGLWTFQLDLQPAARARKLAAEIEKQGWGALWVPEAVGREPLTHAAVLLGATKEMVVATGVANVWSRSPSATAAAQRLLADDSDGRFLLGLGVSHGPLVEGLLGMAYERPLAKMRAFLDGIDDAFTTSPPPDDDPPRVLAALGPKMLQLAAERSWGAHTYLVPVDHTPVAREALGDGPMLLVEQAVVLSTDEEEAREVARRYLQTYLPLPNYAANLQRLGFDDDDLAGGGSDKLVDAVVAWGDVEAVVERVTAHREAGADHVCLQVLDRDATAVPMVQWRRLAEALVTPRKPRRRRRKAS
jgi:probable F420-dependent oxidoreductase